MNKKTFDEEQPHALSESCGNACGARTRKGHSCKTAKVLGKKRCRMHGGAPGSGAPLGNKNAYKHGSFSAKWIAVRAELHSIGKYIDKNGEINFSTTREDSLNELLTAHENFSKQIDNVLCYFADGLISGREMKRLTTRAKKQRKIALALSAQNTMTKKIAPICPEQLG